MCRVCIAVRNPRQGSRKAGKSGGQYIADEWNSHTATELGVLASLWRPKACIAVAAQGLPRATPGLFAGAQTGRLTTRHAGYVLVQGMLG